jgi:hypothetical protein
MKETLNFVHLLTKDYMEQSNLSTQQNILKLKFVHRRLG